MRRARRWLISCAAVLVLLFPVVVRPLPASAAVGDWSSFLFDSGHSSYNAAATSISPSNLSAVEPVWRWLVPPSPNTGSTQLFGTPVVRDGVVYIGAADGEFYAVDEATRAVLWSQFLGLELPHTCSPQAQGIMSTATITTDPGTGKLAVYVNAPDGYLYALDAQTGSVIWRSIVGIPSTTQNDYFAWGSPLVVNGNVYVGIASDCDNPLVQAGLLAFNQSTGTQIARWNALPGTDTGASIWSTPAALPDGSIIVGTGNAQGKAQPLYGESIVRLDGTTLSVLDAWQVSSAEQSFDGDFGASPTVFIASIHGVSTQMVGACNKNGLYYALQANNLAAGPVWEQRITQAYVGGSAECAAAAIWDGSRLIEGGGDSTKINGVTYQGSVQALDPATGTPIWQTGLPGEVVGSPTEDGNGVVAAQIWASSTGNYGVYLLSASTGAILGHIKLSKSPIFAQPVFSGNDLLVAGAPSVGLTAYEVTIPGPPVTGVSPNVVRQGTTTTLTVTGSGFSGHPTVFISDTLVKVLSTAVVSPTTLSVRVTTYNQAVLGARDVIVIEPGPIADTCSSCLTVDPPLTPPTPTAASPNTIPAGEIVPVTLTGSNFQSGAKVTSAAGISVQTAFVSSSQLNLKMTVSPSVAPGSYNLSVTNPDGGIGKCGSCLTVAADPPPALTAVSPATAGQQGAATLTFTGTDFTTNSTVSFSASGIKVNSLHYSSPTTLVANIWVSRTTPAGPGDVTVTTPGGSATCSGCLAIDPHPAITGISPSSAGAGTTTTFTVSGSSFASGLTVSTSVPGATVGSPTSVTANSFAVVITVPSGTTAGTYSLKVTNPDGGTGTSSLAVT
jgi:outer membrane protein assembly factor BamB